MPNIKQKVRDLLKFKQTDEVQKLTITGRENDDKPSHVIDFIANRVKIFIKVEQHRFASSIVLKEKYELIQAQYLKIRKDLLREYKKKKKNEIV